MIFVEKFGQANMLIQKLVCSFLGSCLPMKTEDKNISTMTIPSFSSSSNLLHVVALPSVLYDSLVI